MQLLQFSRYSFLLCFQLIKTVSAEFCVDTLGCFHGQIHSKLVTPGLMHMPVLGLGTAGLQNVREGIVCDAISRLGYRLIDTAEATEWYSEDAVGQALEKCRGATPVDQLMVVTKIHPRSYL